MHPEIYFTLVFSFIIPTIQHNAKLISIELTVFFPTCDVCRVSIYSIQTCICSVERQNTSHTAVFCLSLQTHFCSKLLHQSLRKDSLSATAQEAPCGCKKKSQTLILQDKLDRSQNCHMRCEKMPPWCEQKV